MKIFSYFSKELEKITDGTLFRYSNRPITHVTLDSNSADDGAIFFPFPGTHTDGHRFLCEAVKNGASAVCFLQEQFSPNRLPPGDYSAIAVTNMQQALDALAIYHRKKHTGIRIALTGSVGKTTTKEFLRAVFSSAKNTHATEGNYNNALGVPLTLLSTPSDSAYAIYELGMSGAGEISHLSSLVAPHVAIITGIGTAHIESLGSRENIARAKLEILDGLLPNGILLCDGDEPLLNLPNAVFVAWNNSDADYRILDYRSEGQGSSFTLRCKDSTEIVLSIPVQGRHCVFDAALAFACADLLGVPKEIAKQGLTHYQRAAMRQEIVSQNGYTFLCDCYNASPESMCASLDFLCEYAHNAHRNAIAVLGDMLELGSHSAQLHRRVGAYAATLPLRAVITFGKEAHAIAQELRRQNQSISCDSVFENDIEKLASILKKTIQKEDVILLKASRAMRLERILPLLSKQE